jgi:hypothetical protein
MKRRSVRRLAWVGVALCVVALAFGVTVRVLEPPPGVTEANFARLRLGMTQERVESIVGRSPDDSYAKSPEWNECMWRDEQAGTLLHVFFWKNGLLYACFGCRGKDDKKLKECDSSPSRDRLRSLLGW